MDICYQDEDIDFSNIYENCDVFVDDNPFIDIKEINNSKLSDASYPTLMSEPDENLANINQYEANFIFSELNLSSCQDFKVNFLNDELFLKDPTCEKTKLDSNHNITSGESPPSYSPNNITIQQLLIERKKFDVHHHYNLIHRKGKYRSRFSSNNNPRSKFSGTINRLTVGKSKLSNTYKSFSPFANANLPAGVANKQFQSIC
jgi:hypothetical protein